MWRIIQILTWYHHYLKGMHSQTLYDIVWMVQWTMLLVEISYNYGHVFCRIYLAVISTHAQTTITTAYSVAGFSGANIYYNSSYVSDKLIWDFLRLQTPKRNQIIKMGTTGTYRSPKAWLGVPEITHVSDHIIIKFYEPRGLSIQMGHTRLSRSFHPTKQHWSWLRLKDLKIPWLLRGFNNVTELTFFL